MAKVKRNSVSHARYYEICKLLERDRELVPVMYLTQLADRYSEELGETVTVSTIGDACKNALNLEPRGKRNGRGHDADGCSARIDELETKVAQLGIALSDLCRELGVDRS